MSAICGIWQRNGAPVTEETIQGMLATLAHRGIDGAGCRRAGPLAFGYHPYALTPESLHAQLPLHAPASQGTRPPATRLDTRAELCDALDIPHPDRATTPDGALILAAYL